MGAIFETQLPTNRHKVNRQIAVTRGICDTVAVFVVVALAPADRLRPHDIVIAVTNITKCLHTTRY